jgi:tetratricopeptide (TPR) repeat protein
MFLFSFWFYRWNSMKTFYLKIIFTWLLGLSLIVPALSQRSNGLTIEGSVTVEEGSVDGAVIQMFRDGRTFGNYGIGSNGQFKIELNYNHEFILIFSRNGNFPQKIAVDTKVPRQVLQSDPLFPPFPLNVKLFTEIPGIDRTFSENTVMKIYYSERVDNFISDLFYNDAQIKHLIDQAILQSRQIGREADYLAGLTKAELAELRKEYDQLIREAENEYEKEEFLKALDGYQAASKIFPKEQYPIDRIAEINDLLGLLMVAGEMQQALTDRLTELIKQADKLFAAQKYTEARNVYHRALSVDPENRHAILRSDEIAAIIRQQQVDQEYQNWIVKADNSFKELLYVEAKNAYQQASQLKLNESYPKQRITEIDKILNQQTQNADRLKSYDEAIFQAELNFEKQFYERAISFYENAVTHKPGDELAMRRIEDIKNLMNELANRTTYDKIIKSADRSFQRKQYNEAIADYEHAADLLPNEEYPQNQISRINELFAEQARLAAEAEAAEKERLAALQAEKDRQYVQAVSRGDSLFNQNEYENSRSAYQLALQVKPEEIYPQQRIDEIAQILTQLATAQQLYDAAIARGDRNFQQEDFNAARTAYTEAQQAKPDETYPAEQIVRIDSIVETRTRLAAEAAAEQARLAAEAEAAEKERLAALQAEKDRQYVQAVSRGDSLFNQNEYENSRSDYLLALQVKPEEIYPQQRIDEIAQILTQLATAQQLYDAAIARGDRNFQQEDFNAARTAYTEAQQAKPDETYPAEQIVRIDSIVETRTRLAAEAAAEQARLAAEAEAAEKERLAALQAEKDRQYVQAVSRGDSLFNQNEYENSKSDYQLALQVKPEEIYPQQRIDEIAQILTQLATAQQLYDAAIARGDRNFQQEDFNAARTAYTEAQQAKPDETYPAEQIVRIDSIVETRTRLAAKAAAEQARLAAEAEAAEKERLAALQAEKDRQYVQAVSRGDNLFNQNEYENSRSAYQLALQVKPEEIYPQQRIDEIAQILTQLATAQQLLRCSHCPRRPQFSAGRFLMQPEQPIRKHSKPNRMKPTRQNKLLKSTAFWKPAPVWLLKLQQSRRG